MRYIALSFSLLLFISCGKKATTIHPTEEPITESIYASGLVKSKNQYQAFSSVNGIIDSVFVSEGDSVKRGSIILSVSRETQQLSKENAELAAAFSDLNANQGKLNDAKQQSEFAKAKMLSDSSLYFRQKTLWQQEIGSKVELEQRELAYQNSRTAYLSSQVKYNDLKRQLDFTAAQSKKNLMISSKIVGDYTLKSEIDGIVYNIAKLKGEIVGPQTPLAVIGSANQFVLEMQVDEYDILRLKVGLTVLVTLDSYKGKVFEARVTKIFPFMNERSKTFLVEAEFINQPEILYPNMSFEANIVIQTKEKAVLIPRNYLLNDSTVVRSDGEQVKVKTGLKDYQKIEIVSGLNSADELKKPNE